MKILINKCIDIDYKHMFIEKFMMASFHRFNPLEYFLKALSMYCLVEKVPLPL